MIFFMAVLICSKKKVYGVVLSSSAPVQSQDSDGSENMEVTLSQEVGV